jgi:hypothetical protein
MPFISLWLVGNHVPQDPCPELGWCFEGKCWGFVPVVGLQAVGMMLSDDLLVDLS